MVSFANALACQCLASISKAVHYVREYGEQLHQQCVYRQYHITVCGSGRGEEGSYRHKAYCTKKNISVHGKETAHGFGIEQTVALHVYV